MCGDGYASPEKFPLKFGERLCLEPSDRRGRASTIIRRPDGKAQPFRTSGGIAARNPTFKDADNNVNFCAISLFGLKSQPAL
jgi:hypothetical protein